MVRQLEKLDFGKNLKVCSSKNVDIYSQESKGKDPKTETKIDIKIFCHVSEFSFPVSGFRKVGKGGRKVGGEVMKTLLCNLLLFFF